MTFLSSFDFLVLLIDFILTVPHAYQSGDVAPVYGQQRRQKHSKALNSVKHMFPFTPITSFAAYLWIFPILAVAPVACSAKALQCFLHVWGESAADLANNMSVHTASLFHVLGTLLHASHWQRNGDSTGMRLCLPVLLSFGSNLQNPSLQTMCSMEDMNTCSAQYILQKHINSCLRYPAGADCKSPSQKRKTVVCQKIELCLGGGSIPGSYILLTLCNLVAAVDLTQQPELVGCCLAFIEDMEGHKSIDLDASFELLETRQVPSLQKPTALE